jgi:hypothetical protein
MSFLTVNTGHRAFVYKYWNKTPWNPETDIEDYEVNGIIKTRRTNSTDDNNNNTVESNNTSNNNNLSS